MDPKSQGQSASVPDAGTPGVAVPPPTSSGATPAPNTTLTSSDLSIEEEVAKELGTPAPVPKVDKLEDKAKKLSDARIALEARISTLESDVKSKLATLKELKATIEQEIQKIKELKETEGKIDVELHKIEELEKKRAEIESEIKIIEEAATGI